MLSAYGTSGWSSTPLAICCFSPMAGCMYDLAASVTSASSAKSSRRYRKSYAGSLYVLRHARKTVVLLLQAHAMQAP